MNLFDEKRSFLPVCALTVNAPPNCGNEVRKDIFFIKATEATDAPDRANMRDELLSAGFGLSRFWACCSKCDRWRDVPEPLYTASRLPGAVFKCKDAHDAECDEALTAVERVYDRGVPIRGKRKPHMQPAQAPPAT